LQALDVLASYKLARDEFIAARRTMRIWQAFSDVIIHSKSKHQNNMTSARLILIVKYIHKPPSLYNAKNGLKGLVD
jgi:hypothetical protein